MILILTLQCFVQININNLDKYPLAKQYHQYMFKIQFFHILIINISINY